MNLALFVWTIGDAIGLAVWSLVIFCLFLFKALEWLDRK